MKIMKASQYLTALVVGICIATPLMAQSCGPLQNDGFEIGCCTIPTPTLPAPPAITMLSNWGVISGCNVTSNQICTVVLGAPSYFECDYAIIPITVLGLSTMPPSSGILLAKYARTWMEPDGSGALVNVWRFMLNTDLVMTPTAGCPAGACLPPSTGAPWFKPAHFVGHVDYTCQVNTAGVTTWNAAFSLSHLPGCFQHAFFSTCPIPALAASNRSYHLVGPAPFNFAPVPAAQGPLIGDSQRSSTLFFVPFFYFCHGETDAVTGGSVSTVTNNCFCSTSSSPLWAHQNFTASYNCGGFPTNLQSIPVGGTPLAPTGFATLRLGAWVGGGNFPGTRELVVHVGVLSTNFTCSPVLFPLSIVTGVSTSFGPGGTLFSIPGTPPITATVFMDLQNMLPLSLITASSSIGTPGLGSLFASDHIISVNLP